jgi:pimeloyl-ACP methyl ester carboxylesterase
MDYLGNGRSDKPNRPATIENFAQEALEVCDALGFERFDIWGSHTGASVALEVALRRPSQVGKIILEAPVLVSENFVHDLLERFRIPLEPRPWGSHLLDAWNWRKDLFQFWPWYEVTRSAVRSLGLPRPKDLHLFVLGIIESGSSFSGSFNAAFSYDMRQKLPLLECPALVCAGPNDMFIEAVNDAAGLVPVQYRSVRQTPTTVWWPGPDPDAATETLALYEDFLNGVF